MTERKGVEIDFCTQCRGIWLDRGELDKILEISAAELTSPAPQPIPIASEFQPAKADRERQYRRDDDDDDDDRRDSRRDRGRDRDRYKERKRYDNEDTLLHRIFDFFD